jgi:propionate CoA-transferase
MNRFVEIVSILKDIARHRIESGGSDVKLVRSMLQMLLFRLTWRMHDLDFVPSPGLTGKFMSARQAVKLIPDGACVISTGIAGNGRCSIFYWGIRDRFLRTGGPARLTWISVAAHGGRGKAPGTIEELAVPGLITCHIGGHLETHKALLNLADEGWLDLHTMSQGVLSHLIDGQASKEYSLTSPVGIGTFIDPRVGNGSCVVPGRSESLVKARGDLLEYRLPPIDAAIFSAPYADAGGNIYFKDASTITENLEAVRAARANNGLVLATVCGIMEKNEGEISIPSQLVDAIVVNPRNEQTGGVLQRSFFPMFTQGSQTDMKSAYNLVKLANTFTGITPMRDGSDHAMARQAASILMEETGPGALVNIGVGLPEDVCRHLFESGSYKQFTFTTESGAYGGIPVSGMYFGAAINPVRLMSSVETFRLYEHRLDASVLGFLQVDSSGNVNVSRRGPRAADYVGPGGFTDIVTCAKTLVFIGKWMQGGAYRLRKGKLSIGKYGASKFVDRVDEITFNGQEALAGGRHVYYVTNVGVFKLTPEGLCLIRVMPGIDVIEDILKRSGARIVLPGACPVELVSDQVLNPKAAVSEGP